MKKIKKRGPYNEISALPEELKNYLLNKFFLSSKRWESVLGKILAQSLILNEEEVVKYGKKLIDEVIDEPVQTTLVAKIKNVVCDYYNESDQFVFSQSRKANLLEVRQVAMYFLRKYTDLTYEKVGKYCGDREHATALHAFRVVKYRITIDSHFQKKVDEIDRIIRKS